MDESQTDNRRFYRACSDGKYKDVVKYIHIVSETARATGFFYAVRSGHSFIVDYLLDHVHDVLEFDIVDKAFEFGDLDTAKVLIRRGADITDALQLAIFHQRPNFVEYLIDNHNVEITSDILVYIAKRLFSKSQALDIGIQIAEIIRMKRPDIDLTNLYHRALHFSCEKGDYLCVKYLLENGVNPQCLFEDNAPIFRASSPDDAPWPREMIVKLLLEYGADPDDLDPAGATSEMKEYIPINPRRVLCAS